MFRWSCPPLIGDMDWVLIGENDDRMVPEPQDTSHVIWEGSGDPLHITWVTHGNSVAGGDNGKNLAVANSMCRTQYLKASGAYCREPFGEAEGFSHVSEISGSLEFKASPYSPMGDAEIFGHVSQISDSLQFRASATNAVEITEMACTMAKEGSVPNRKLADSETLSINGSIYDDDNGSEKSSSCYFSLMNARPLETNELFEEEHMVSREDDLLEYPWDNIDDLSSSLEDMDNIFRDSLFPSDACDVDDVSPIPILFPALQSNLPAITLQSEIPSTNLKDDGKNGSTCLQLELERVEDRPYLPYKEYMEDISQGASMKPSLSREAHGTYDTKLVTKEISMEALVLHQLEVVIMQLSLRTRICIRDAFYRLARSARQRHAISEGGSAKRVWRETLNSRHGLNPVFLTRHSRNGGSNPVETETNAIDRSIAELLFCK